MEQRQPDKPDIDGRTPIWYAVWGGHEGLVKILLGQDDINPDKSDIDGRTPLWCAAATLHKHTRSYCYLPPLITSLPPPAVRNHCLIVTAVLPFLPRQAHH